MAHYPCISALASLFSIRAMYLFLTGVIFFSSPILAQQHNQLDYNASMYALTHAKGSMTESSNTLNMSSDKNYPIEASLDSLKAQYIASIERGDIDLFKQLMVDPNPKTVKGFKAFFKETGGREVELDWTSVESLNDGLSVEAHGTIKYKNRRGKTVRLDHLYKWQLVSRGDQFLIASFIVTDRSP